MSTHLDERVDALLDQLLPVLLIQSTIGGLDQVGKELTHEGRDFGGVCPHHMQACVSAEERWPQ